MLICICIREDKVKEIALHLKQADRQFAGPWFLGEFIPLAENSTQGIFIEESSLLPNEQSSNA